MEFSTRKKAFNLESLINYDLRYVMQYGDSMFLTGNYLSDLEEQCKESVGVAIAPDFVKEAEVLLNPDELKILIHVSDRMYHVLLDTLPLIVKLHNLHPNIRFVLYVKGEPEILNDNIFHRGLVGVLEALGVKYFITYMRYSNVHSSIYRVANFVCLDNSVFNLHDAITLADVDNAVALLKKIYLGDEFDAVATRKVYLTRPKGSPRRGLENVQADEGGYTDDIRIYDEDKLKDFFSSNGFEIVTPEEKFKSIEEQIQYMSEVKVLAAVSASGLSNSIFMEDNGTVIEMLAEVVTPKYLNEDNKVITNQTLPSEYFPLSFMRGHTHIMISSFRDSDKVIKELNKGIINCL